MQTPAFQKAQTHSTNADAPDLQLEQNHQVKDKESISLASKYCLHCQEHDSRLLQGFLTSYQS